MEEKKLVKFGIREGETKKVPAQIVGTFQLIVSIELLGG